MNTLFALDCRALSDGDIRERCRAACTLERRERADRFRQEAARDRCLAAGWLLAESLKRGFGLSQADWEAGPHGKPLVKGHPEIQVNLSHSGCWAVCAVGDRPVGVDVESACPKDYEALASRFLAKEEQQVLARLPKEDQGDGFRRLWTLKESYIKYTGEGLSRPLASFDVSGALKHPVYVHQKLGCCFAQYGLPDGTPVAFCTQREPVPPAVEVVRIP